MNVEWLAEKKTKKTKQTNKKCFLDRHSNPRPLTRFETFGPCTVCFVPIYTVCYKTSSRYIMLLLEQYLHFFLKTQCLLLLS